MHNLLHNLLHNLMSAAVPGTKLSTHGGSGKAWLWSALDFADGEQKMEMLAIRFGTTESALPSPSHKMPHQCAVAVLYVCQSRTDLHGVSVYSQTQALAHRIWPWLNFCETVWQQA